MGKVICRSSGYIESSGYVGTSIIYMSGNDYYSAGVSFDSYDTQMKYDIRRMSVDEVAGELVGSYFTDPSAFAPGQNSDSDIDADIEHVLSIAGDMVLQLLKDTEKESIPSEAMKEMMYECISYFFICKYSGNVDRSLIEAILRSCSDNSDMIKASNEYWEYVSQDDKADEACQSENTPLGCEEFPWSEKEFAEMCKEAREMFIEEGILRL